MKKKFFLSQMFLIIFLFGCKSTEIKNITNSNRKIISNQNYKEVLYVTNETTKPEIDKTYCWYKSQNVYKSKGNYSGKLLNAEYIKYFYTNELAEKGFFEKGLKKGQWISWYKSGNIKNVRYFKKGVLFGEFIKYDSLGNIVLKGKYINGLKQGKWVSFLSKDTIVYRKGRVVDTLELNKPTFFKRIFIGKEAKSPEKKIEENKENTIIKLKKPKKKKTKKKVTFKRKK